MGIGNRLSKLMDMNNTNANELAKQINVSPQTIYSIIKRDSKKADIEVLLKIADVFGVTAEYFVDEAKTTQKTIKEKFSPKELEHLRTYCALDPLGRGHVDTVLKWETNRMEQLKQASPAAIIEFQPKASTDNLMVEYFRSASAGSGVFILGNEVTDQIAIPNTPENRNVDFAIKVSGDSMFPDYEDGDIVLVSQKAELRHGDVGIFIINSNAYIKEYGEKELISRNPESDNIQIAEYDNIVCMGKVVGKLSNT